VATNYPTIPPADASHQPEISPVSLPEFVPFGDAPDFAAKVRWRMLHDRNPLFPILQDKIEVKRFAHERGVATPATSFVTDDPALLPFDSLTETCFIKANHGSGWNFLCDAGQLYYFGHNNDLLDADGKVPQDAAHLALLSREQFLDLCRQMLNLRFAPQEWAYQVIPPRIFVEERLYPLDGGDLRDYRFYTFDGVVRAINVGSSSYRKNRENIFLTPQWEPIAMTRYVERLPNPLPARPANLQEMIAAAQRLCHGIDFMRVDLYGTTRGVMLGEITLYPGGGLPNLPTACPRFNHWLASFWKHPGHAQAQWSAI